MAGRKSTVVESRHANLRPESIREAIPKLRRRIAEIDAFDPHSLERRGDPRVTALEHKIQGTLVDALGHETVEYRRYRPSQLDSAPWNAFEDTPLYAVMESVAEGLAREKTNLETVIDVFQEHLADAELTAAVPPRSFGDLGLHADIEAAAAELFGNGHYRNAVEDACKALDMLVKGRSGRSDLTGTELMELVFSPKNPILKFNDQTNASEKSEQAGMARLYSGVMLAFRNPRAHGLVYDDPDRALEYIGTVSMLARALELTRRA